jgi:signal transduction histidine kinase
MSALVLVGWSATALLALALAVRLRVRAELVARACHEVRGPLTAAALALHAARRPGASPAAIRAAEAELERAGGLLADLRAAARGHRPRDRRVAVDVGPLLAETARTWRAVAVGAGRELRFGAPGGPLVVRADPRRLAQVTGNLLANALEHGAGPVSLQARADGDRVRIDVTDGGPGGAAPKGRRRGRRGAGRGRGLAVSADIVGRHGGRLVFGRRASRVGVDLPAVPR